MSKKENWKNFGKNTGQAFVNFGKSVAKTANIVVGNEDKVDENGNSKLKQTWSTTGKGFGTAGKSLGKAASETFKDPEEKPEKENPDIDKDGAIDD